MALLVQREEQLAAIEGLLDVASGGAAVAVVEGPAGIGKTALVRAARERAAERGVRVLHAVGDGVRA